MKADLNLLKRISLLTVGLLIMAIGVDLSIKADLGTSPISCMPYVYSLQFPVSIGLFSIILNLLLIFLQILLLRKRYQWVQLIQIPVALLFGVFIDLCMPLMQGLEPSSYSMKAACCLLSCVVLAFGVFLEVKARVTYLAGEGLALAVTQVCSMEFGKAKVTIDSSLVILGIISSLLFFQRLEGIREGTILAALLVGLIARFFSSKLTGLDSWLGNDTSPAQETDIAPPDHHIVITIAREFGSGGHEIGQRVAEKLGIAFYDSRLIELTAAESGFTPEYVKENEQKLAHRLLYELYEQNYAYVNDKLPPLNVLFMVQSKVIRTIAQEKPCVIVGRAADFVLKSYPDTLSVFVHADKTFRIRRIGQQFGYSAHDAEKKIEATDHERENYSRHYTHRIWGHASNYHLVIDSSCFGIEHAAELICEAVKEKQNHLGMLLP
ncbi:cytidylate kinase family protein [Pontiellaceae bacterium B12219]|nr:cytidylate kinase family protein [Pontiellaceae bacterium B12219]